MLYELKHWFFRYRIRHISMKDIIVKPNDQPTWYENGQLIEEYLKGSKKSSTAEEAVQTKKQSLLELLKTGRIRAKSS